MDEEHYDFLKNEETFNKWYQFGSHFITWEFLLENAIKYKHIWWKDYIIWKLQQ